MKNHNVITSILKTRAAYKLTMSTVAVQVPS